MPLAPLKIITLGDFNELGQRIDNLIVSRRKTALENTEKPAFKITSATTIATIESKI